MLTKLHIYIIFFPFIAVLLSSILFLFFQILSNKNYLSNLIISFLLIFFLLLIVIYKLSPNLNDQEIFYLIFAYLCSSFISMSIIQAPISGLQFTILRIIYSNPGISRKEILKKYSPVLIIVTLMLLYVIFVASFSLENVIRKRHKKK